MIQSRHLQFYIALASAIVAGGLAVLWTHPLMAVVVASNAFFAIYVLVTLARIPHLSPAMVRRHAAMTDIPVSFIFMIGILTVVSALAALFILLNADNVSGGVVALVLACAAVPLGWLTIHLMAAVHYAHLFWQAGDFNGAARGLDFPHTQEPGGFDFIYLTLMIGMTAGSADVSVTSQTMRRANVLHAITSFFFNTVLVAAAVNAAVALSN